MKIQNFVHARSFPHVTAHVFFAWEKGPKIGQILLARYLEGTELENRFGNGERFGHDFYELSNGLAHVPSILYCFWGG